MDKKRPSVSERQQRWTIYVCPTCQVHYENPGRCHFTDHPELVEVEVVPATEIERLREAMDAALAPLGTGECSVNACDGCKYETQEAIGVLREALGDAA